MNLRYQSYKLSDARAALIWPHTGGESEGIFSACEFCALGLHDLDRKTLDDEARECVRKIDQLMDNTGVFELDGRGLWALKAGSLTEDKKFEVARAIDELAHYFEPELWSSGRE